MIRQLFSAVIAMTVMTGAAKAAPFDITTLSGYGVATSSLLNFNGSGGWGGWSAPTGKVVLGAKIISPGDSISDFSVFRPGTPGETIGGYTFGANEYGWRLQDNTAAANNGVQFEVYYADLMPGYTITTSSALNYNSAGGWAGWSAPSGNVVSGCGYSFSPLGTNPQTLEIAVGGDVYPHYTFGAEEQGCVAQNGGASTAGAELYVISFDAPAPVPLPAAAWMLLAGLGGLTAVARRRKAAA